MEDKGTLSCEDLKTLRSLDGTNGPPAYADHQLATAGLELSWFQLKWLPDNHFLAKQLWPKVYPNICIKLSSLEEPGDVSEKMLICVCVGLISLSLSF